MAGKNGCTENINGACWKQREPVKRGVMAGLVVAILNERFDKPGENSDDTVTKNSRVKLIMSAVVASRKWKRPCRCDLSIEGATTVISVPLLEVYRCICKRNGAGLVAVDVGYQPVGFKLRQDPRVIQHGAVQFPL